MNIEALTGMFGALPEQQGATVSEEGTELNFNQVLKMVAAEVDAQNSQNAAAPESAPNVNWLGMLLKLFDQCANDSQSTPDPNGEALPLAQEGTSVSLTEIKMALQPLVSQELAVSLVEQGEGRMARRKLRRCWENQMKPTSTFSP